MKTPLKIAKPFGRSAVNAIASKAKAGGADLRDYSKLAPTIAAGQPAAILNLARKR